MNEENENPYFPILKKTKKGNRHALCNLFGLVWYLNLCACTSKIKAVYRVSLGLFFIQPKKTVDGNIYVHGT